MTARREPVAPPRPSARGLRFGIVLSDYHAALGESLLAGALRCFEAHHVDRRRIPVHRVPGAFEIPQAVSRILETRRADFDALVCLGVLIRGETSHFDVLAREVARGIGESARQARIPLAFGVLTVDNERQARERAGGGTSNKGYQAALAAIRMAALYRELETTGDRRRLRRRRGPSR